MVSSPLRTIDQTTFRISRHAGVAMRAIPLVPFAIMLIGVVRNPTGGWNGLLLTTTSVALMEWYLRTLSITLSDTSIEYTELLRRKRLDLSNIAEAQVLGLFDVPTVGNGPMELILTPRPGSDAEVVAIKARMFPRPAIEAVIEAIHRNGGRVPAAWLKHNPA
jgi:hypothetical protein